MSWQTFSSLIRSLLLACAIAFLLLVRFNGSKAQIAEHPVITAFLASGAAVEEVSIDGWALVDNAFLDFTSLKVVELRVAQALGLNPDRLEWSASGSDDDGPGGPDTGGPDTDGPDVAGSAGSGDSDSAGNSAGRGFRQLTARASRVDGARIDIVGQSLAAIQEGLRHFAAETYLAVRVVRSGPASGKDTLSEVKKVRAAVAAASDRAAATTMVYVVASGRVFDAAGRVFDAGGRAPAVGIDLAGLEKRAAAMLRAVAAEQLDSLTERNLVSITAFTDLIPDRLTLGGRDVNLNIALRHDATDGYIYVTVGSPIISEEY